MKPNEKILKLLEIIADKVAMSPKGADISYRAGEETIELNADDEIMILNKLESEGYIIVKSNYSSDYI
jgi:hypothetical protein